MDEINPNNSQASFAPRPELSRVERFMTDIRSKGGEQPYLLNYFSPPDGYSRSGLLDQIWDKYEKILPACYVHVRDFGHEKGTLNLTGMLAEMINQLHFRLPDRIADKNLNKLNTREPNWLAEQIVKLVNSAREYEKISLLLIDDYDLIPASEARWLESKVLTPIIFTRAAGIILTSEFELKFREAPVLRMYREGWELTSLPLEAISDALPGASDSFKALVYRLSAGMPALADLMITELRQAQTDRPEDLKANLYSLLQRTVFNGIDLETQSTLEVLAVLRQFDVPVLESMLPPFVPGRYTGYSQDDYVSLLDSLGARIQWRIQGNYELEQGLASVLKEYLQLEKYDYFVQINQAARETFSTLLQEGYREAYLVEMLFHAMVLLKDQLDAGSPEIKTKISAELLTLLSGDTTANIKMNDLDSLRNTLRRDAVLKDFISETAFEEIRRQITVHAIENRAIQHTSGQEQEAA